MQREVKLCVFLDDGCELLTIQMILAPNLSDDERENVIKLGVAVAIDALSDGVDDEITSI